MDSRGLRAPLLGPAARHFRRRWLLASAIGGALATTVLFWPRGLIKNDLWGLVQMFGGPLVFGPLLAMPQGLVLRRLGLRATSWVITTSASMLVAWMVAIFVGYFALGLFATFFGWKPGSHLAAVVAALPAGSVVGWAQSFIVTPTRGEWTWVAASAAGASAGWIGFGIAEAISQGLLPTPVFSALGGVLGGAAYGAITGIALVSLWNRQEHQSDDGPDHSRPDSLVD